MLKYKKIALGYTISMLVLLMGCSHSNVEAIDSFSEQITLSFGYHEIALPKSGIMQNLAKDFEGKTGIRIEFIPHQDALWRDSLKAQLMAGNAPDIFVVDSDPFSLYDRIRPDLNCIDLSNEAFVNRMDPTVLPAISYDGHVYGITFSGPKIWVYVYNKDIFDAFDLSVPTNYEELKSVAQVLLESGITPMWQATSSGWHQVLPLFETGPLYQSHEMGLYNKLNNNTMTLLEIPQLLTVIEQIHEFAKFGYYGNDFLGNQMQDEIHRFVQGDFAMTLEGIGWPQEVIASYPDMADSIGIFVMPWADNQYIGVNPASNAFFGNINSPHQEAILEFFRFLAEPENLQKRMDGNPNDLALCWPEIPSRYPQEYQDYLNQFDSGLVMQAGVSYIDIQWMTIGEDLEKMFVGLMTPDEVFENIHVRREKLAKMHGDDYFLD